MEANNDPLKSGKEKADHSLLKQQINNFLMNYFGFLVLSSALLVFVAGTFWLIYPQYKKIVKNNETARETLEKVYQAKESYLSGIENLKKIYQSISEADRKKITAMVPADKNVTGQIPEIESIVVRNGAVLNSIKIGAVDTAGRATAESVSNDGAGGAAGVFNGPLPEGVKLVKIEVNLGSVSYPVLKNIVKSFENNLRIFDIAKIDFNVFENKAILLIYSYYFSG